MKDKQSPSFVDYLTVLVKWRRFITKAVLIIIVVAVVVSLIIPSQFTATATILPPNPQQEAMMGLLATSLATGVGGLTGIGSLLPGATTPSDLYAAILSSRQVLDNIIKKYDLKIVFRCNTMDETYRALNEISNITVTPEGIVSVSVTWYDKHLAADIANSYIEELNRFNTETAMTTGKKYRIFVEGRLKANMDTLEQAENALRTFQEVNKTVALDEELQVAIATIAQLKSQIIMYEVQKGAWSAPGGRNSPFASNIDRELRELKKQLAKIEFGKKGSSEEFGAGFSVPLARMPEVALEYARLLRDVKVQEAIYELLTQQYEQARIMELKDTPTVQFLDKASPPEKRSIPVRSRIVMFATFAGFIFAVIAAFILETFDNMKQRPREYQKWIFVYDKIRLDLARITKWCKGNLSKILFFKK